MKAVLFSSTYFCILLSQFNLLNIQGRESKRIRITNLYVHCLIEIPNLNLAVTKQNLVEKLLHIVAFIMVIFSMYQN